MERRKVDIMMRRRLRDKLRSRFRRQRGFGLLELLIAMSILAIGTLGILKLQMQSGLGNTSARFQSAATNLARSKMEEIRRLDTYTVQEGAKTDVEDDGGGNDLGDWDPPDHSIGPLSESRDDTGAKLYTVMWNVRDDDPIAGFKTIRIRVKWNQGGRSRYVEMESQIGPKNNVFFQ
jgi:prepilin-type N-terminal cleavage/methylation domain-containing protein